MRSHGGTVAKGELLRGLWLEFLYKKCYCYEREKERQIKNIPFLCGFWCFINVNAIKQRKEKSKMSEKMNCLLHGGDYNPEQWLDHPEILEEDIERFHEAGINTVSMGIFSWAFLEPEEGVYRFEWMEKIIDHLYENGISVILATPSGARPRWLADKYPEVLRVNERRERELFGKRHNHCLTSPVYREKVYQMDRELSRRFGKHPAVRMWHISNEFGGECHCPLSQGAFREWVKKRYQTLDRLNSSWCTAFWSHTYTDFAQVESPSPIGEESIQGLALDWKRFITDQTTDFMKNEIRAIREGGSDLPVTTNMMYDFEGLDYARMAPELDVISWDNYPTWHKMDDWTIALDAGMQHDLMRSLKGKPFLLMESCPGATNWQSVSHLPAPGIHKAAGLMAVAHGSDSVLYFQLRQSRGSEEKFHGAVIDHYGGNDTRMFREVCETGETLKALGELAGTVTKAKTAIVYDTENKWAIKGSKGPRNKNMYYKETVQKSYRALREQGLDVDIINETQELTPYQFVAAPMVYLFREGFDRKLKEYVENGGTLLATYWSGVVDENDRCYLGGTPHGLMDVFGLREEEIDGLYDGETNGIVPADGSAAGALGGRYSCAHLCEIVKPSTAETLMVYENHFYAGAPALLRNRYGKGIVYYLCADAEQEFYDSFYPEILAEAGVTPLLEGVKIPKGVSVTSRENETSRYLILQNFSGQEQNLPYTGGEKILGGEGNILQPLETWVFREKKGC